MASSEQGRYLVSFNDRASAAICRIEYGVQFYNGFLCEFSRAVPDYHIYAILTSSDICEHIEDSWVQFGKSIRKRSISSISSRTPKPFQDFPILTYIELKKQSISQILNIGRQFLKCSAMPPKIGDDIILTQIPYLSPFEYLQISSGTIEDLDNLKGSIKHSAQTFQGCQGAPITNKQGEVVAVQMQEKSHEDSQGSNFYGMMIIQAITSEPGFDLVPEHQPHQAQNGNGTRDIINVQ